MSVMRLITLVCTAYAVAPSGMAQLHMLKPVEWAEHDTPATPQSAFVESGGKVGAKVDTTFHRGRPHAEIAASGAPADGSIAAVPDKIGSMEEDTTWMTNQLDYNEDQLTKSGEELTELTKDSKGTRGDSENLSNRYKEGLNELHQMDASMNTQKIFLSQSEQALMQLGADEKEETEKTSANKKKLDKMLSSVTKYADNIFSDVSAASQETERQFAWSFLATDRINSNSNTMHGLVHDLEHTDTTLDHLVNNILDLIARVNTHNDQEEKEKKEAEELKAKYEKENGVADIFR